MSVCSNHSQHLVQLGTLTLFGGLDLVNNLFAASLFLSGQGHFRWLLHAVQATVGDLRLVETPRPAECAGYSELCVELLTRNIHVRGKADSEQMVSRRSKTIQHFVDFASFFNGSWWDSGPLEHFHRGDGQCCAGSTPDERLASAQSNGKRLILKTVLRVKPQRAAANKWNKFLPCFDFFFFAMCPHQLLKKLCHEGMGSLRAYYEREAGKGIRLGDEMNFHKVAGSRLRRLEGMLDSCGAEFAHKVIEVVCEGGRALSTYFQHAAEGTLHHGVPVLCDLSRAQTSVVVCVLEYLSGLARGLPAMARLIWQHAGHQSFEAWFQRCPGEVAVMRRVVLFSAASNHRRHGHFMKLPFSLARLGDARSSCQCVDAVVEEIHATSSCCLPPGTIRFFKERSTDLRSAEARKWVLCWAMSQTTSLADTERMHARNRYHCSRSNGSMNWESMAAQAVNHQAAAVLKKHRLRAQPETQGQGGAALEQSSQSAAANVRPKESQLPLLPQYRPGGRCAQKRGKAKSALEVFRADFLDELRSKSEQVNPCSKETWERVRSAWASCPEDVRKLCHERAAATKGVSHQRRCASNQALEAEPRQDPAALALVPRREGEPEHALEFHDVLIGADCNSIGGVSSTLMSKVASDGLDMPPLSAAVLDEVLAAEGCANLAQKFKQKSTQIAMVGESGGVPIYPKQCRGLCETGTPSEILRMQRDLLKAFETSCGPPRVGDDVLIVCEVKDEAGIVRKRAFFLLAESCGRHGRHAAVQTFLVMSPASLHDALAVSYDGVSLVASRLPQVTPVQRDGTHVFGRGPFKRFLEGRSGQFEFIFSQ